MKKFLSLALCLILLLTMAPVQAAADTGLIAETKTTAPDPGLPDNNDLFAAYAEQTLYGTSITTFGIAAGSRLTGDEKTLYDAVVPYIKQIASGERTNTVIGVGQTVSYNGTTYVADAKATFTSATLDDIAFSTVVSALLSDYPYELYWYDKTDGCKAFCLHGSTVVYLALKFEVADNYGTSEQYTTDASKTTAAAAAAANAQNIVDAYALDSDYEKLQGYKQSICDLVSYDKAAADSSQEENSDTFSTDNDPWQLIHVFDGDSTTNVVCEGYSKAFMYLCDLSTFSGTDTACYTVSGTMGGGAHMWNIVTLDGANYLVDVTNSEIGTAGQSGNLFLVGTIGSPAEGYTFAGYPYLYSESTLSLWGTDADSILTLAEENYNPNNSCGAIGHTVVIDEAVSPTCTDTGLTEGSHCSACGAVITAQETIPATGHRYEAVVTAPTCAEDGFTTHTCSACGDSYTDSKTDALGHDLVFSQHQIAATCTAEGKDLYACSRCTYSEPQTVEALGHRYTTVVTPPTCTEQGYTTHTCSACGNSYADTYMEATGHTMGEWAQTTAPSCESAGAKSRSCTVCAYSETEEIPALGHHYSAVVTTPTCNEQGYTTHTCSVCGDSYVDTYTDALGHSFGSWYVTEEATCAQEGSQRRDCANCDHYETETIAKSETHTWDDGVVTTPATEDTEGVMTYTCTVCKTTKTETIPTLDHVHSYEAVITAPTCEEDGYTTHSCRCGNSYTDSHTDALGHDLAFSQHQIAATCMVEGKDIYTCSRCAHSEILPVEALGHHYESVVTAPTCEENGCTTHTCTRCGDSYSDEEIAALGHDLQFSETLEAPTCDKEGTDLYLCTRCDHSETAVTNALGHNMVYSETLTAPTCTNEGSDLYACSRCEHSETIVVDPLEHSFGSWTLVKLPTDDVNGSDKRTCEFCGETETRKTGWSEIDAPKVTASNVASSGKIKLTWSKVDGAVKYYVYRSTSKNGTYSRLSTTTKTTVTHSSAVAGKLYYYCVYAVDEDGNVSKSSIVSRTCDLAQPVVTITNDAATGKPALSWEEISGAVSYKVYRATSKSGTYKLMKTTASTSMINSNAVSGKTYYYKVLAVHTNTSANSAYSAIVSRTCDLAQPTITLSNVASSGKIKVSWKAVEDAVKYEVYRAASKTGTYTRIKTTTSTSFTNTGAVAGKTYYYKVRAIAENSAANSAYSAIKSRTCDLERPDVTLKLNGSGKPRLSWDAIDGAVKYQVYRSTSKNGTYSLIKTTTNTYFANTGAKRGTTYYYKVRAVASNTGANSAYSIVNSITAK